MNKQNIYALADFIESCAYAFNMSNPIVELKCGSAGCIGGHAAVLWPDVATDETDDGTFSWAADALAEKLDITTAQENSLTYPTCVAYDRITPQVAGRVLRLLAETGRVDWRAAMHG